MNITNHVRAVCLAAATLTLTLAQGCTGEVDTTGWFEPPSSAANDPAMDKARSSLSDRLEVLTDGQVREVDDAGEQDSLLRVIKRNTGFLNMVMYLDDEFGCALKRQRLALLEHRGVEYTAVLSSVCAGGAGGGAGSAVVSAVVSGSDVAVAGRFSPSEWARGAKDHTFTSGDDGNPREADAGSIPQLLYRATSLAGGGAAQSAAPSATCEGVRKGNDVCLPRTYCENTYKQLSDTITTLETQTFLDKAKCDMPSLLIASSVMGCGMSLGNAWAYGSLAAAIAGGPVGLAASLAILCVTGGLYHMWLGPFAFKPFICPNGEVILFTNDMQGSEFIDAVATCYANDFPGFTEDMKRRIADRAPKYVDYLNTLITTKRAELAN